MDQQHAIDRGVGQRQFVFLDQSGKSRAGRRPTNDTLRGRHHGKAAFRLVAEQAEIGRRIADAEDAQPVGIVPPHTDAVADKAAGHDAKLLAIKIAQVDHIHDGKLAWNALSFCCPRAAGD